MESDELLRDVLYVRLLRRTSGLELKLYSPEIVQDRANEYHSAGECSFVLTGRLAGRSV